MRTVRVLFYFFSFGEDGDTGGQRSKDSKSLDVELSFKRGEGCSV